MKKALSVLLAVVLLVSGLVLCVSAEESAQTILSQDVSCVILLPTTAINTERYAATKLQSYLEKITGIKPRIASTRGTADRVITILHREVDAMGLPDGSYTIALEGDTLSITGSGRRGCIYGVFGFLERYCQCRWYTKDVIKVPAAAAITVPADEEYTYTSTFEYTETDWSSPRNTEYSMANGLNGCSYRYLSSEQGGNVTYLSNEGRIAHTLTTEFCAEKKYFEEHPEYFALRDGKRSPTQLCLTNPDVLRVVTEEVLDLIQKRHDPTQALEIVSLTQDDNKLYCTCPNCEALDRKNGSQSGTMITFANAVAKAVKEAGYDRIAIDTFAYQYTRKTPTQVVPEDNVIVRLCTIECCFAHPLADPNCKQNVALMEDLQKWSEICNRIYIWDYTTNYGYTVDLFPDFGVLQKNIQTFAEYHAKGIYEEGNYYMNECDGEFGELRSYLLSKLMQNPNLDVDAEMNGFLEAYYGAGWENIRAFLDGVTQTATEGRNHLSIGTPSQKILSGMSTKTLKYYNSLWEQAKNMAQDETTRDRVERSELCWRYAKNMMGRGEFSRWQMPHKWMTAQKELYEDYVRFGTRRFGELPSRVLSTCSTLYLLRKPNKWVILYDETIWDKVAPTVEKVYNWMCKVFP